MGSKLISVIVPAYNAEKTIIETLDSIKSQLYTNYEVIIVDDGSIDNTSSIAREYALRYPRFKYYYQENAGVSMARNRGIELSNGKYICFLDADDFYNNKFLKKMYEEITKNNSRVCYCGYNIVSDNIIKPKKTDFKNGDILLERLLGRINISSHGWMIEKEHIKENKISFLKGISWSEDFEFFNEIVATTNDVCFVNEYLVCYKVGYDESQLSNFTLNKIDGDYHSIMRTVNNKKVNKNRIIEKSLIDYRLHGAIIYRLLSALNKGMNKREIKEYYERYKPYITKWTFNNGLRSIKLNINRMKLIIKIR